MDFKECHAAIKPSGVDGRGLFAAKNIPAGELIFTKSRPLVAALDTNRIGDACSNCFRTKMDADIYAQGGQGEGRGINKCTGCRRSAYCSKTCQSAHWKRCHKEICKKAQAEFGNDPPQVPHILTALIELITMREKGTITEREWVSVLQLKSNSEAIKREDHEQYELALMFALGARGYATNPDKYPPELLSQLGCAMLTNSLTLVAPSCDPLGICFDPFLSIANHSCDPNAYVIMDSPEVSFRTLKPIKKDDEVFVSYVDNTEPRDRRQRELKKRYHFKCNCSKCALGSVQDQDKFLTPGSKVQAEMKDYARNLLQKHPNVSLRLKDELGISKFDIDTHYANIIDFEAREELQAAKESPDIDEQVHYLEKILKKCKHSGLYAYARQPCPATRHELILASMEQKAYHVAWTHAIKTYVQIDPILYPEPHHPLRVVHAYLLVKLCTFVASEAESSPACRLVMKNTSAKGLDMAMLTWKVMKEAAENVKRSHGPDNSFTKMILATQEAATASVGLENWDGIREALSDLDGPLRAFAETVEY